MIEMMIFFAGILYAIVAVVYSIKMENDKVLMQIYKAKSSHDWSEICFAVGFAWPLGTLIHYIMRRRNATT